MRRLFRTALPLSRCHWSAGRPTDRARPHSAPVALVTRTHTRTDLSHRASSRLLPSRSLGRTVAAYVSPHLAASLYHSLCSSHDQRARWQRQRRAVGAFCGADSTITRESRVAAARFACDCSRANDSVQHCHCACSLRCWLYARARVVANKCGGKNRGRASLNRMVRLSLRTRSQSALVSRQSAVAIGPRALPLAR